MAAASDRARQLSLAAQGTCDRSAAPCFLRSSGCRPPHTNFRFGGDTSDCRGTPGRFSVLSSLTKASRLLEIPATLRRGGCHPDSCVYIGEVGQSCPQPGGPRGGAVSPKGGRGLADQRLIPENFRLLRLG